MVRPQKEDFISGFAIFLIALPLCMGIAMASGFPAIAGIITAIVGGGVASFVGSSRLTIKGPAAGLIVIAIAAVQELGGGDSLLGYKRCLAVLVVAALLQITFAALKWGSFAELMPPSVVHGMLAAIGLIIIAKQTHVALGVTPSGKDPLHLLMEIPHSLANLNPEILCISAVALFLLVVLPKIKSPWMRHLPAPLLVIFATVALSLYFGVESNHQYHIFGLVHNMGPNYLVNIPANIISALTFPDFSNLWSMTSFKFVLMFAIVGSIESLLTVSAVDSLDPQKQTSDLNKDLFAVGVGNLVAAMIGGLPMISEIVRSKANIDNGAKTHWANVIHAVFLLSFVVLLPHVLHLIPLAALAAMLIYVGARLTSPREFVQSYYRGLDQFLLFTTTFGVTIFSDLLVGVIAGLLLKLILHKIRGASFNQIFKMQLAVTQEPHKTVVTVTGPSTFTNFFHLKRKIHELDVQPRVIEVDFKRATLIDLTVQNKMRQLQRSLGEDRLMIAGLEHHRAHSTYPDSTKVL